MTLDKKLKKLEEIIKGYNHILVALSGGVDSTFLLAFAYKIFNENEAAGGGPVCEHVGALTAMGPQFARDEIEYAESLCETLGIPHKKIDASHIINMIKRNPIDRCYQCKMELFGMLKERADMVGSILVDGTNADDMKDYRPGYEAVRKLGVKSPLKEAELTKKEIREALGNLNVNNAREMAQHPAFACLATRIPYGETITEKKLAAIYEAEQVLKRNGFDQVRVRCHEIAGKVSGNETRFMARIELENADIPRIFITSAKSNTFSEETDVNNDSFADRIESTFKKLGFEYVTLDLGGYSKGKMNSMIEGGLMKKPDRIKFTETARRGDSRNIESDEVMARIDKFLKETEEKKYGFCDFIDIIERLRKPDGCPWDREQTHESLKKHLIEEANEVLDAIDEKDREHLCEELGDLLLQIALHAQIAKESGEFTIEDVVQCVSEKMIRRHPHVFGNIDVFSVDEGLDIWEEIKKREKMQNK